ncbi:hypothetical protein [uncultured Cohaesibacter sp.]|uniref:hypothetical protein n=1 Tax=uncultured Cohaesibacter sp. TaxID=1002546 RepID=UPI0029C640B2|nr:hypothetical protein [uncultured Cohaesibacter sp.]
MNRLNEDELYELHFRVCVAAVAEGFPHIPVAHIIEPINGQFDAILARQIVLHILVVQFGLVRSRVAALMDRRRTQVNNAIMVVDNRLDDEEFAKCYIRWAARTEELYLDELAEVA